MRPGTFPPRGTIQNLCFNISTEKLFYRKDVALSFILPPRPIVNNVLQKAVLRINLEDLEGDPSGAVSIYHGLSDNLLRIGASHFQNLRYTDTLIDLVRPGDQAGKYYEVDVTELLNADYSKNAKDLISSFRLQVDGASFIEDNQSHDYIFTMPGADANRPELILTFVPEPSMFLLAAVSLLSVLTIRIRSNCLPSLPGKHLSPLATKFMKYPS